MISLTAYHKIPLLGFAAFSGTGKTTLLGHLTLVYAKKAQGEYHRQAPADLIPVFLSLRDHREQLAEARARRVRQPAGSTDQPQSDAHLRTVRRWR